MNSKNSTSLFKPLPKSLKPSYMMISTVALKKKQPNIHIGFGLLLTFSLLSGLNCHGETGENLKSRSPVSVVSAEQLERLPGSTRDIVALLRTMPTHQPGLGDQTTNVTIRGIDNRATSPLYIVDGVRASDGAMAGLDPSFIQNVEILKGPSGTALYGSAAKAGVVIITTKGQVGYTDNPWRQKGGDQDSSLFLTGGIGAATTFKNGNTSLTIGADIGLTQYEQNFNRNGDDEYDFNASYLFKHKLSDDFFIQSYASMHVGAHQSIERGYQRTGLGFSNAIDWHSRTSGHYSLDGNGLGSGGIEGATAFIFNGFNELDFDERDVYYYGIEQEVSRTLQDGTQVGVTAEYGMTNWKRWGDYDADVLKVGGFVRRDLGSGFSATVSGGWEQRDYGQLDIKRNDFYLNGTINGPLVKDKIWFFAAADYGVQQNYLNANSSVNWVDPIGLRIATGLRATDVGPGTMAVDARVQHLESDLFNGPSQSMLNYSLELSYVFSLKDFEVAPSIIYFNDDFDNGNDSDGFAFSLSMTKNF